jgi:hypothetical protein
MRTLSRLVVALILLSASPAGASGPDDSQGPSLKPDFLFGRPRGWIAVRASWLMPRAGGDLFTFVRDQLTLDKRDFQTPAVIGELGIAVTPRLTASAGVEFSRNTVGSEYRRFIDNQGLPITQTTALSQANISGSVRLALVDPGRRISQLAFIPRTITPYVGAGGGAAWYDLKQSGDFVDFATFRVFVDVFSYQAWTPSAHVFGGAELRLWRGLFLDTEGRYVWAKGPLGSDFIGFDGIDLNGFRVSTGIRVVF